MSTLYSDDIDSGFLGTTYEDPRENNETPADLAVLVDDEGREESLGAEDKIPVHQRPWTKVLAVLAASGIGVAATFAFLMGGQPKSNTQLAKAPPTQGANDRTNFTTADDATKTEIALGKQRNAFEGSASPSPTPTDSTANPNPSPTPSVIVNPNKPLVADTRTPTPLPTVKADQPVAPKPAASVVIEKPKPVIATQNARLSATVAQPSPKVIQKPVQAKVETKPPTVARVIPLPTPSEPLRRSTVPVRTTATQPQKIAPAKAVVAVLPKPQLTTKATISTPSPKSQPIARVVSANPQPIAKAVAPVLTPTSTPLSPEEQWLKMSEASRFGGRFVDVVATNSIPAAVTGANPVSIPTPETSVAPLPLQNRTIHLGSNHVAEVDENLIAVPPSAAVTPQEIPTPTPSNFEAVPTPNPAPSEFGLQTASFKAGNGSSEAADKESLKPLITEFGVVSGSGLATSYSIPPGTRFAGTLLTPVQAAGSSKTDQLLAIQLDQPILDKDRRVAVAPQNAQIIFRWSLADGWIQATSESLVIDGKSVSVTGAFVLQGNDGQPLVASTYQPGADEVAAADRTSFLLGAAKGVGDVLTAPDTSIVTNGLGGVTSASTANRDILGAVLKGGADPVLQGLTQRNQQRSQAIQSRKPIWYLQPGAKVNIYTTTPLTFTK